MKKLMLVSWLLCSPVFAGCWKVADLHGPSFTSSNQYLGEEDKYSSKYSPTVFEVNTGPSAARVTGHEGMACQSFTPNSVTCLSSPANGFISAVWFIDETAGVAVHTKTTTGLGPLDGARIFIGRVVGKC